MEGRHDLRLVHDESPPTPVPRPRELALSWVDRMAATALVDGSSSELAAFLELARGCAEALAGEDANGARRRLLAREIAIAKTTLDLLTASIGDRVRAGDEHG